MPKRPKRLKPTRESVCASLGITWPDVEAVRPQIHDELDRIAKAVLRECDSPVSPYYLLALSKSPDAIAVLHAYHSIPATHRNLLPIEAFCLAAKVDTTACLDAILISWQQSNRYASAAIVSSTHPAVVARTIHIALKGESEDTQLRAQTILHRAVGFLPLPRGAQTVVNVQTTAQANAAAASASHLVAAPPPEQTIRRLSERLNALRGSAPPRALPVAVEIEPLPAASPLLDIERPFAPRMTAVPLDVDAEADDLDEE